MWDGYFNDKNKQQWLDTAEKLKHINDHVLQDIEDFILLKTFAKEKPERIKDLIETDHNLRIQHNKKFHHDKDAEVYEAQQKEFNKRRRFMNTMRPPHYWNFFEDGEGDKVPHVLRFDADPRKCYKDGRIEFILENIEAIGMNLKNYETEKWKKLVKDTHAVFVHDYNEFKKEEGADRK